MGVNINGVDYETFLEDQENYLTEYYILDDLKNFINSKMPADISYFNTAKLDEMFRTIDNNGGKSEDYAYAISSIVVNIGNAARQPSSLEKCYKANIRYKGQLLTYYNKYKDKLSVTGKEKIRHSVEAQFKHFEFNVAKIAFGAIKGLTGAKLNPVPAGGVKIDLATIGASAASSLVDTIVGWMAIKYYDLLEAVRVYKRAAEAEFDTDDLKSARIRYAMQKEAKYFYDIAFRVLQDMLKLYDEL